MRELTRDHNGRSRNAFLESNEVQEPNQTYSRQSVATSHETIRTHPGSCSLGKALFRKGRIHDLEIRKNATFRKKTDFNYDSRMAWNQLPELEGLCYEFDLFQFFGMEVGMEPYSPEIERMMKRLFESLREQDRRRYAAIEAAKLGHCGINYIRNLFECNIKTIRRGVMELASEVELNTLRSRKVGMRRKKEIESESRQSAISN